jgi:hypothetical protein
MGSVKGDAMKGYARKGDDTGAAHRNKSAPSASALLRDYIDHLRLKFPRGEAASQSRSETALSRRHLRAVAPDDPDRPRHVAGDGCDPEPSLASPVSLAVAQEA